MVDYVESPFEQLVSIHLPKKPDDGGGEPGTGNPICVPKYVHSTVAWFLYSDGGETTLLPQKCCPPQFFVGEHDYAQYTVWAGGATTLTLTVDLFPNDYMSRHPTWTIGAWIRPQQNPRHFLDPLLWVPLDEPGIIVTFGPAGEPTQTSGNNSTLTVTIPLYPHALTPADVPGAPPADPDRQLIGTTMVQFAIWDKGVYDLGLYRNAFADFPDGSTLTVEHDCPPNSIPFPPAGMIGGQYKRR